MDDSDDIRVDSDINGLFCRRRDTLLQNDVLASEAMKKVHAGPEVTERRHPSKNEDQTRKKIFWTKFCLYLSSEAYSVVHTVIQATATKRAIKVPRFHVRDFECKKINHEP